MISPPFRSDVKITEILEKGGFTLSAEIIPPRNGAEQAQVLEQVSTLIEAGAQFLAVTKGAGGSLRGGSLPIAQAIKEKFGIPCIAHFTCRDLLPEEVENQLMDHHYFGIRNILALRGDPPDGQSEWKAREGGYSYACQLMEQIQNLNRGIYLKRPNGPKVQTQEATDFCIGAAVYPEHPVERERIDFFQRKVDSGAQYAITNMLFDAELFARFLDLCGTVGVNIPVLPGTRILRSRSQAEKMMLKFKVPIAKDILNALPEADGPGAGGGGGLNVPNVHEKSFEVFYKLVEQLKSYGAPGIHLFVITDIKGASIALKNLAGQKT